MNCSLNQFPNVKTTFQNNLILRTAVCSASSADRAGASALQQCNSIHYIFCGLMEYLFESLDSFPVNLSTILIQSFFMHEYVCTY